MKEIMTLLNPLSSLPPSSFILAFQCIKNAVCRVSVPERRDACVLFIARSVKRARGLAYNLLCVSADDTVRSHLDCDRSLRVLAQGQTGNAERGCLFLYPAGIRQHELRAAIEAKEIQIAEWVYQLQIPIAFNDAQKAELLKASA